MENDLFKFGFGFDYVKGIKDIKETIDDNFEGLEKDECKTFKEQCMLTQCKIDGLSGLILAKKIHKKENLKDFKYIIKKFEETIAEFKQAYEKEMEDK